MLFRLFTHGPLWVVYFCFSTAATRAARSDKLYQMTCKQVLAQCVTSQTGRASGCYSSSSSSACISRR